MADQDFPDDENGHVLRRLHARGVDLTMARDIDFAVVFEDQASALAFCAADEGSGRSCVTNEPDAGSSEWEAIITVTMVPTHMDITAMEDFLTKASMLFGGRNDGWGFLEQRGRP